MPVKTRRKSVTAATPPAPPAVPAAPAPATQPAPEAKPADPMPTSGMVCLLLDTDTVKALTDALPPPDGAEVPSPPHITLNFLGPVGSLDRPSVEAAINAALSGADTGEDVEEGDEGSPADTDTITGVFGGFARFAAEEDDGDGTPGLTPIMALFDSPDLDEIQAALEDALEAAGAPEATHGFTAHTTLYRAMLADGDTVAFPAPPMLKATFGQLALVWGDYTDPANITMFPIAGPDESLGAMSISPEEAESAYQLGQPGAEALAAVDAPSEPGSGPDAVPDEGRVVPMAGPLGMFEACLVTEGVPTDEVFQVGDGAEIRGRLIPEGLGRWRTPPIPGGFAMDDMGNPADKGHENAPVGCSAVEVVREGNRIMARGPYLDNVAGAALKAAADGGAPIGPSISFVGDVWDISVDASGKATQTLLEGSIAGFCVLPYEAQHSGPDGEWLTWFRSAPDLPMTPPEAMPAELPAMVPIAASAVPRAVVACGDGSFGAPLYPPREWFETPPPGHGEIMGMTVTDEGQIFGHAAGGTCHIGIPGTCLRISDDMLDRDFRVFHKGLDGHGRGLRTAEGDTVQVGQITLAGGHADTRLGAADARKHYDDTDSVIANVRITWDPVAEAPYMAGAIQHTATEGEVQQLRAAGGVSVDYRELEDGRLHLVALPAIPVGGFPPLRALSAGGELKTLILTEGGQMAVIGAADLPIAPRDTSWDAGGASQRVAKTCTTGDKLDPSCFGRAFFWRDDSQPDTNVGSYKFPFADVINGKLQAVYAGVSAGAGRLGQADIPAADKERIRGKMAAYYRRFAKAFNDPSLKPPWESSQSVTADALVAELGRDFYSRRLREEAALLASAHEREKVALGVNLR